MVLFRHILTGFALVGFSAQAAFAGQLTRAEQTVCSSLRMCLDIVRRHDASEFDYSVLAEEFRRYGPAGRAGLFNILEGEAGTEDIARLIAALGPLSAQERAWRDAEWGGPNTARLLPLADDTTQWVALLNHPDRALRERGNEALFTDQGLKSKPIPQIGDYRPLLSALQDRPSAHLAKLLVRIPVEPHRTELTVLLLSGEANTVGAAYAALYRDNPSKAFQALLSAMRAVERIEQAQGIGGMLAERQAKREDNFYQDFTAKLSGDADYPVTARAAALDGYLKIMSDETRQMAVSSLTPAQRVGFGFLMSEPNTDAPYYAAGLTKISPSDAPALWRHLDKYVILDAQTALTAFEGQPFERDILRQAFASRDGDVRRVAQTRAKLLRLAIQPQPSASCRFTPFDIAGLAEQMPFFENGFIRGSWPQIRTPANRRFLSAAHPTKTGWLGGYDMGEFGGGLISYDNRTGDSQDIQLGSTEPKLEQWIPENVVAILPDRPLPLGQTTDSFWVVTGLDHMGTLAPTVFKLTLTPDGSEVQRLAHNIGSTDNLAVTPQGELLMGASNGETVRLASDGRLLQGCPPIGASSTLAPN